MPAAAPFEDARDAPAVRGFLHLPDGSAGAGIVLTHGAGGNANGLLLVALAEAFAAAGVAALRCDLPFRQARPHGPPYPAMAERDRAGLKRAVGALRERVPGKVYLGGHSYGGRQATMLAAEEPELVAGLLLQSYPLHPPGKPAAPRTAHFPKLTTRALFVHGTRDPFGSPGEMRIALELLAGPHHLVTIEGVGHDLGGKRSAALVARTVVDAYAQWLASLSGPDAINARPRSRWGCWTRLPL